MERVRIGMIGSQFAARLHLAKPGEAQGGKGRCGSGGLAEQRPRRGLRQGLRHPGVLRRLPPPPGAEGHRLRRSLHPDGPACGLLRRGSPGGEAHHLREAPHRLFREGTAGGAGGARCRQGADAEGEPRRLRPGCLGRTGERRQIHVRGKLDLRPAAGQAQAPYQGERGDAHGYPGRAEPLRFDCALFPAVENLGRRFADAPGGPPRGSGPPPEALRGDTEKRQTDPGEVRHGGGGAAREDGSPAEGEKTVSRRRVGRTWKTGA